MKTFAICDVYNLYHIHTGVGSYWTSCSVCKGKDSFMELTVNIEVVNLNHV
jgi:hypothetical protein